MCWELVLIYAHVNLNYSSCCWYK